jgi:hypothetical protein
MLIYLVLVEYKMESYEFSCCLVTRPDAIKDMYFYINASHLIFRGIRDRASWSLLLADTKQFFFMKT